MSNVRITVNTREQAVYTVWFPRGKSSMWYAENREAWPHVEGYVESPRVSLRQRVWLWIAKRRGKIADYTILEPERGVT